MDRGHPGGEGDARLAAGQLGVGVAERGRRRVGDPAVGVAGARVAGDPPELVGVGRGEGRGLVDRARSSASGRRAGVARRGADGAGREAARAAGAGRGSAVAHGADATPDVPRRRGPARRGERIGTPVTRSLPARFEAYIAPSALIDQLVRGPAVVRVGSRRRSTATGAAPPPGRSIGIALTPSRIFSARTKRAGRVGLGQEHDELVAAVAGRRVDLADALAR